MNDVIKLNIQSNNEPYELKIRKWNCNHQIPRASIILIHGIKDHVDRYNSLANTLVTNGYVVYGYDQKGHGLSISEKYEYGFIGDNEGTINSLLTDLDEVVKLVRKENSKKKVFIIGHNIGGVLALRYAQLYNDLIDGLILSGVPFESKTSIYIKKWSAAIVSKIKGSKAKSDVLYKYNYSIYNKYVKKPRTKYDWLNTNEAEIDKFINCELCGEIYPAITYKYINELQLQTQNNIKLLNVDLPIYTLSGKEDSVTKFGKQTKKLNNKFKKYKLNNINSKQYIGSRHDILFEYNKFEVYSDILSWISKNNTK